MSNINKGLNEAYGRYGRRDAYQRDYDSSVAGMGKRQSYAYQQDGGANDEGWDEPERSYQPRASKPVANKGYYFYNVPAGQDDKAREVGLFQTKTGKWYSPFQNTRADMFFGTGKFWAPKNESIQEEEQLDELSPQTLASYKKKAGADATQADKRGDYKRGDKRMSGIMKATRKEFDNDAKGVAEGTEQVYKVLAVDKSNALSKQVKLKVKASSLDEVFERLAISDWYPLEINGVEVVNGKRLKQDVAEGSIGDKIKGAAKSVKRAAQGWGVGGAPDMITPKGVVQAFGNMDGQRLANFVASRKELSKPGKDSARAFADKVIDREMKQRGYGRVADKDEQGVAEGSSDTVYPNAEIIKSKNGKPVGEIYQDGNSWGAFHYRADRGYDMIDSREDAIEALKDLHQETGRSRPDYTIKGVAEGSLNEFAPDGFNGGDDGDGFDPDIAKMAQDDGFTKGVSLADGATLERAMAINYWHKQHGGMYKQYFAKGFKEGRLNKIKHDNRQYNLNLKLMKDGSIRHGEQGVAEGPGFDKWADERAASQLHKLSIPKTWEVSYDYGPHMTKTVTVKARSEEEARAKVEKAAEKKGMSIMINSVEPKEQGVAEGSGTGTAASIVNFIKSEINRYYEQDNDFAAQWLAELVHVLTDSRPGWKNLTYDEIMQYFIQYDIDRLLKDGSWEARKIAKVYHNLKQQIVAKFGPKQGVAEGLEDKVVFKGHTIGHIETDSDGDPVGIVYSNNPQSKRPFEIYGYEDVNQLKREMISQWNKRVPKGVAEAKQSAIMKGLK